MIVKDEYTYPLDDWLDIDRTGFLASTSTHRRYDEFMNADLELQIRNFTQIAIDLALSGADSAFTMMGKSAVTMKADRSILTDADLRVQDMIVHRLRQAFPAHGILAEEKSPLLDRDQAQNEFVWVIDPIDGTRNYAAGIPIFTCSIALFHRGSPAVAAIALPKPQMLFQANICEPAKLNHRPIAVADRPFGNDSVLAVSASQLERTPGYLTRWFGNRIIRDYGSAALHLALVAAGMIDAAFDLKTKLWDIAAGALIVARAGGKVMPLDHSAASTGKDLWPMDLARYHGQNVPVMACSAASADALLADMSRHQAPTR